MKATHVSAWHRALGFPMAQGSAACPSDRRTDKPVTDGRSAPGGGPAGTGKRGTLVLVQSSSLTRTGEQRAVGGGQQAQRG